MPHPYRTIAPRFKSPGGKLRFFALVALSSFAGAPLFAQFFTPGNLVVSRSVYEGTASTLTIGETLPPDCPATAICTGAGVGGPATNTGAFPAIGSTNNVWNNDAVDGSFGVTSPIFLDQITPGGTLINTLTIPTTGGNQIVTSFSSKSELALNLSLDGNYITFMGYITAPNTLDASNSNTPGVYDPTNPVGESIYRGVAKVDRFGNLQITETNAYSGNNGRAAIYTGDPGGVFFAAGNDNNGNQPTTAPYDAVLTALINATGVQVITPGAAPGTPLQAGSFNITEEGYAADKPGKDNNFRGLTIFDNTLYVSKGSGSNGIDTVYQVGPAGTLPTAGGATITVLPGFPIAKAKTAGKNNIYPFGLWFANSTTLYVGDEGDGTPADASSSIYAGLQKWSLVSGSWVLDYVLQNGLSLGQQYGVSNYPTALNPATDGLRNIAGRVNADGTATIWAVTSTVSANGDQGADPNLLVSITDNLANLTAAGAASETFAVVKAANYGEVLRGVTLTPKIPAYLEASCGNAGFPYGRKYTCEVNVGSVAGGATGSITYTLDGNSPVSLPLSGGFAQFSLPTPNAGPHTLVIDYPQQGNFTASGPSTQEFTVVPALSSVQLTPSNYYPGPGSSLTLWASVTSYTAPPPTSGTVSFYGDGALLGVEPVGAGGTASLTISPLPAGHHSYEAQFGGLPNYSAGGSNYVTINVP